MSELVRKLRIAVGQQVAIINSPVGFEEELGELPDGVVLSHDVTGTTQMALLFANNSSDLTGSARELAQIPGKNGLLWIAFPKRSSGIESDLGRDKGWELLWEAGLRGIALISIDKTWSAMRFVPTAGETPQDLIASQYSGRKSALRPIYDRLISIAKSFGDDVEIAPRKTYVALSRKKQFAVIKASTNSRVDLGLKLKGFRPGSRLEDAGNFGSGSITHKVSFASADELDDEVVSWFRSAYEGVV